MLGWLLACVSIYLVLDMSPIMAKALGKQSSLSPEVPESFAYIDIYTRDKCQRADDE